MKKFLSLALALVMTFSLVTISAGAKDYTDDSKITYQEAVDVVSAAGIVDGYADGSFNPNATLTRGAAAKIICNMILGPTTAAALSADTAPYSDVPTNHTFAGYIAYCQKEGIISGYADGTFRPSATLTSYAFMKMLLGALGYDAEVEGYTGSNWSINVAKRALNLGLDDDLATDFVGTKAVTREEACLYAFNTLKATMVEYDTTITIGDITIAGSKATDVANNSKTETIKDDGKMQFAERYFSKLTVSTKSADKQDDFGRPATTWIYDKDTVGTYADGADETIVVADGGKDLATILTGTNYLDYDAEDVPNSADVWTNGAESDYGTEAASVTSKGSIIEVYEDDEGVVTDIVVRIYSYAKIDEIEDDLSATFTKKGASVSVTLKDLDDNTIGSTYYDDYDGRSDLVLAGFDAATYTEDTVLAVALNGTTILDSYVADVVTGTPTAGRAVEVASGLVKNGTVTIDGTKYTYAGNLVGLADTQNVDFDEEYDLYLTAEGYVMAIDGAATITLDDLYYVTGVYQVNEKGTTVYYAQTVALSDGTVKELKLENDKGAAVSDDLDETAAGAFGVFQDSVKGIYIMTDDKVVDGSTTICKADNDKWNAKAYNGQDKYSQIYDTLGDKVSSDAYKVSFTASGNNTWNNAGSPSATTSKAYITSDTIFIAIDGKSDGLDVKFAKGSMQMAKNDPTAVYTLVEDGKNDAVVVLYIGTDMDSIVDTSDVVYLKADTTNKVSKGYEGTLYFMKDMSSDDVIVKDKTNKGFYTYGVDDDGVYDLKAANELTNGAIVNDDATTGYAMGVETKSTKSQKLTSNTVTVTGGSVTFDDVDYSGATVIDTRTQSDRDLDVYTGVINSVGALEAAVKKCDKAVTANIYVEDGEIIFVAVTAVKNAAAAPGATDDTAIVGGTPSVTIASGVVKTSSTGLLAIRNADNTAGVSAKDVVITYEISTWNPSTNSYNAPMTFTVNQGDVAADTYIDADGAPATTGIGSSVSCKVVVTVTCDVASKTFDCGIISST